MGFFKKQIDAYSPLDLLVDSFDYKGLDIDDEEFQEVILRPLKTPEGSTHNQPPEGKDGSSNDC